MTLAHRATSQFVTRGEITLGRRCSLSLSLAAADRAGREGISRGVSVNLALRTSRGTALLLLTRPFHPRLSKPESAETFIATSRNERGARLLARRLHRAIGVAGREADRAGERGVRRA